MESTELRVLGYVRASTDKQAISPAVQTEQLRSSAELLGWRSLELRREDAASAKSLEGRPVLAAALEDLRAGRADALAVAKLDRLSRSTADFAGLLDRAEREGWAVICLDLGVDTSSNAGRFASEVTAAAAALERRLISQRTREAMARIRETTGKHMGRPTRIPAEVEARIVALYDAGSSASAIARQFNDEGVPKGEGSSPLWNHSHVMAAVRRAEVRRAAG
ncbi:recombinase family protein [Nocardioides halotolerans]|uniref:recombinase family protein n=1 Tax=Nocardioides halotolerans TaxID=433660 RepID=UPI0003F5EEE3|nr:recombinase family protein [Nocardioides halotolerans]